MDKDTDDGQDDPVCHALDKCVKNQLKNVDKKEARGRAVAKNITNFRHQIIKDFMSTYMTFKTCFCPVCGTPSRDVRSEHNTSLFLKGLSFRMANKWLLSKTHKERDSDAHDGSEEKHKDIQEVPKGDEKDSQIKELMQQIYLTPTEAKEQIFKIWENHGDFLDILLGAYPSPTARRKRSSADMFFFEVFPVPPSRFRPLSTLGDKRFENPQSGNLVKILKDCALLKECLASVKNSATAEEEQQPAIVKDEVKPAKKKKIFGKSAPDITNGKSPMERLHNAWLKLQTDVNCCIDSDLDKLSSVKFPGIRQILEKKEGLFRKHMMGKRVNYACRSVISPDPYMNVNEIGIPEVFALKLTYPQPVTHWNVKELRQAVINGPLQHPGATLVEQEDGKRTLLSMTNPNQREAIAKRLLTPSTGVKTVSPCKKVYRHLQNGDVLLLNRQPTLHRPSMMAHKVRVLRGEKTIRLHYANCKSYNADFDGDEMNAHFPQNELARAEAYHLASTNYQYLVPKDGTPLGGLIQDHIVAGVRMTVRGQLFSRSDYQQLVYSALSFKNIKIKLLKPCIYKPRQLWSGKQVVSTVLINLIPPEVDRLSICGKAKIAGKNWMNGNPRNRSLGIPLLKGDDMSEAQVVIRQGELMCGVLDKAHYGPTPFGLVHCCNECVGSRLVLEQKLREVHHNKDGYEMKQLDLSMKKKTDHYQDLINKACIPLGLLKRFPDNNLQLMVQAGAKGSSVNCMQISCLLGQIELEGRRPPIMLSGRSLPSFLPYDTSPRAGGFVDGRFLTGIRPQEYFFHCMAGREGLVDTAVKTSRSGYLQRCLIKHLEGLQVGYDLTVRDSDGSVVQFYYGEDGLDVMKTPFLSEKQFPFMVDNFKIFLDQVNPHELLPHLEADKAAKLEEKIGKWRRKHADDQQNRKSPFLCFAQDSTKARRNAESEEETQKYGRTKADLKLFKMWRKAPVDVRERYTKKTAGCPDPVLSNRQADRHECDSLGSQRHECDSLGSQRHECDSLGSQRHECDSLGSQRHECDSLGSQRHECDSLGSQRHECDSLGSQRHECDSLGSQRHECDSLGSQRHECDSLGSQRHECDSLGSQRHECDSLGSQRHECDSLGSQRHECDSLGSQRHECDSLGSQRHECDSLGSQRHECDSLGSQRHECDSLGSQRHECDSLGSQRHECDTLSMLLLIVLFIKLNKLGSIGEPSTQMTLNTFHFAGRGEMNVTLGIPRLREILMTASERIKTPRMDLPVKPGSKAKKRAKRLQRTFTKVRLAQVLESVDVWESLSSNEESNRERLHRVRFNFLSESSYKDEFCVKAGRILHYMESHFINKLTKAILKEFHVKNSTSVIDFSKDNDQPRENNDKAVAQDDDDDNAELSDEEAADGDANEAKQRQRRQQHASYEAPDEDEENELTAFQHEEEQDTNEVSSIRTESIYGDEGSVNDVSSREEIEEATRQSRVFSSRVERVQVLNDHVASYTYDVDKEEWCEVCLKFPVADFKIRVASIVEKLANQSVVYEIPGINRCFLIEDKDEAVLKTEGVNIQAAWKHEDILDLTKIYTNDIQAMANTYGIEAAGKVIRQELKSVFSAYGIQVDPRHLSLVSDYMTYEGTVKAFNRVALDSNSSPFQKMSFETTTHFLRGAVLTGDTEKLSSPSSRLVVGRVVGSGTGCFELMQPLY
ncbi:PREDICTED: DNA-directed RNA polymerase I subunit RPA1-like [Acropora digitifera]|uniref:DNA-directed RNA polymerase I subunit RPA1-like n=1 Tax=Acropora digitifera TaxID=70779 RepID=UPI000779F76A|nr:PREDICTED: DNA-directed RNA polymerase I subunit RPA1-like [Acropora digitifera]